MTAGAYVGGVLTLAVLLVAALAFGHALRRALVPAWTGAAAALAVAVLGIAFVTVLEELLGAFGGFQRWPLLAGSALIGGASIARARPVFGGRLAISVPSGPEFAVAAGIAALALEPWLQATRIASRQGITEVDSLWYHLPAAAGFAQSGRVTTLRYFGDSAHSFLPWTSELFHATGMIAFHADVLSVVLNLAWATLALLAAWCVGRPYRCSPVALVTGALVLALPVMASSQPASAKNDTAGIALLLAAVAFLVNGAMSSKAVVLPAAAAGLAAGTRLNLLVPVLALSAAAVLASPSGRRLTNGALWTATLVATGSFWYVRNAAITHNPLPWFRIGLGSLALPAASGPSSDCGSTRLTDQFSSAAGLHAVASALRDSLGGGWLLLLALTTLGLVVAIARSNDRHPLLFFALPGLVAAAAYALTPGTGTERIGCLAYDVRFATPTLALGLLSLAIAAGTAARWSTRAVLAALAITVVLTVPTPLAKLPGAIGVGLIVLGIPALAERLHLRPRLLAGCAVAVLVAGLVIGLPLTRRYLDDRYTRGGDFVENITPGYLLFRSEPSAHIGVEGFNETYLLYGERLQHHVETAVRLGARGTFRSVDSCAEWRRWLASRAFDYVVLPGPGAPQRWTRTIEGVERIPASGTVVFRLPRSIPTHCAGRASD
jgi:hypothetical protein